MATQEFHVDYFDQRYLNRHFPDRKNNPHFQLGYGDVGGTMWFGGDPHEEPSFVYQVVSRPRDFSELALAVLHHLKEPGSLDNTYQVRVSEKASQQIGETGTQVLEEILALHNDLVTPRRR